MLVLAKEAIASQFPKLKMPLRQLTERKLYKIPPTLKEKRACFVTLLINGELRGCIGHILPIQELYKDIIENARAAAFDDPRFSPLTCEEVEHLTIEISVLTVPQPFFYTSVEDLLHYLGKNKPGVILSKGKNQATFLPAVWHDLPSPEIFLTQLSIKAGLDPYDWKLGVEIRVYNAEKIMD